MSSAFPPSATFDPLRLQLRGELILPGDASYDSARRLWNGAFDRRPAAIVRCRDVADVVACVKFAREQSVTATVRGGGHGVAGSAIRDGALVVDLSTMRAVSVDPSAGSVWVQGGATWGDVDHATQLHGLAVPGGFVSTTGVGGFTLGGGIAWTSRKLGLACDNLVEAEMVTATGEVVKASPKRNSDLYWALRGGGGNFGVVTAFRFRGQRVGPTVYGGFRIFPKEPARDLLRLASSLYRRTPEEFNLLLALLTAPPAPFIPESMHGRPIVVAACCYLGPLAKGPKVAKPLLDFPGAVVSQMGPMPYLALQSAFDPLEPAGKHNYWKSSYHSDLPDAAIDVVLDAWARVPSSLTQIHFQYFGGAASRVSAARSAVGNRSAPFLFNLVGKWEPNADREANVRFVRELWEALQPFSTGGVYLNFLSEQTTELTRASFGKEILARLVRVKRKYDPDNFFQASHPIAPS